MDVSHQLSEQAEAHQPLPDSLLVIAEEEADDWLNGYKMAWETRDVEAALALFSPDARYCARQLGESIQGHEKLRTYWRDRVFEHQRDLQYEYELWGVRRNELMARWRARYTWLPINGNIHMDGVCHVAFSERREGRLLCSSYCEWHDLAEF